MKGVQLTKLVQELGLHNLTPEIDLSEIVSGHWVKSFQAFHRPCPASGAGFRRGRRC